MRICIPTDSGTGKSARVFGHFGSAPFFTVYDDAIGTFEAIPNPNQHHAHGSCSPVSVIGGLCVDVVVCKGMGAGALKRLNEAGIKAFVSTAKTVDQAVESYRQKSLVEMTHSTCHGHHEK